MILNESNARYHGNKEYDSYSNLKTFIKSPELYKKAHDGLLPKEHKDEWDIGNAVHTAILEPEKLGEYKFADEGFNGATKEGKAIKKECEEKGITLLNAKNSAIYNSCVASIKNHPSIELFKQGYPEVTFRGVNGLGMKVQCRTDWFCDSAPTGLEEFDIYEGDCYVADVKTTNSIDDWASTSQWKNPLTNSLLYAGQELFYTPIINACIKSHGIERVNKWLFVVVEKKEPFRTIVVETPQNALEYAKGILNDALVRMKAMRDSGDWRDDVTKSVLVPDIRIY